MSEWECVLVGHHKNIGKLIEERGKNGWILHDYEAVGTPTIVNHYLLFKREKR
jgi:hypothetical protein